MLRYLIFITLIGNLNAQDKGLLDYNKKEFNNSRLFYEKIVDGRENDDAARYGLGASLYKLNDLENAKTAFNAARNSKDKKISSMANYSLGNIYRDENKLEESLSFYRKAIQLNPNDKEAKINFELLKNMLNESGNDQSKQQESSDSGNDQSKEQESSDSNDDQSKQQESSDSSNDQSKEQNSTEDSNNESIEKEKTFSEEKKDPGENDQKSRKNEPSKNPNPSDEETNTSGEFEKINDRIQAEAILDALKGKEKISQKIKINKSKSTKMVKNW